VMISQKKSDIWLGKRVIFSKNDFEPVSSSPVAARSGPGMK
jgi:hypothetical protein